MTEQSHATLRMWPAHPGDNMPWLHTSSIYPISQDALQLLSEALTVFINYKAIVRGANNFWRRISVKLNTAVSPVFIPHVGVKNKTNTTGFTSAMLIFLSFFQVTLILTIYIPFMTWNSFYTLFMWYLLVHIDRKWMTLQERHWFNFSLNTLFSLTNDYFLLKNERLATGNC